MHERRDSIISQLHQNYWRLDPYVRSRTYLDRGGVIQEGGKIDFYPAVKEEFQGEIEPKTLPDVAEDVPLGAVTA